MSDIQNIVSRVDLVSLPCLSKAIVQQAIDTANAGPLVGFIYLSDTAPNVVTYPDLARYIWMETTSGVPTGDIYYYNGTSWTLIVQLDGSVLINGSITLNKLSLVGVAPYDIIQVNSAGTGLVFTEIASAIPSGSINISQIQSAGGGARMILGQDITNTMVFYDLPSLPQFFSAGSIVNTQIAPGSAYTYGKFLRTNPGGDAVSWEALDFSAASDQIPDGNISLDKVSSSGSTPNSVPQRNATNTGWTWANLGQEAMAVGYSTTPGATIDVTIVKPTGKTWNKVEVEVNGVLTSSDGSGDVTLTSIKYQTAPSAGTNVGTGNTGVTFSAQNNEKAPAFWKVAGNMDAGLVTVDSITIRCAITTNPNCTLAQVLVFAKGYYY